MQWCIVWCSAKLGWFCWVSLEPVVSRSVPVVSHSPWNSSLSKFIFVVMKAEKEAIEQEYEMFIKTPG